MTDFLETAQKVAREAGAVITEFAGRNIGFELKGAYDLVTAADRASEQLIVDRLNSAYPSHAIVAEESGMHAGSSEYRWYVDPLDGTTNFAHAFPVYNVTLALEHARQAPGTQERVGQVQLVDPAHEREILGRHWLGLVVEARPA